MYRFKCETCKNKYIGDYVEIRCPKCGTMNQTIGKFSQKK